MMQGLISRQSSLPEVTVMKIKVAGKETGKFITCEYDLFI